MCMRPYVKATSINLNSSKQSQANVMISTQYNTIFEEFLNISKLKNISIYQRSYGMLSNTLYWVVDP
jgi:hypothetical protein